MATEPPPKKVLVAAVHDGRGESTLGFVAGMLRLQIALVSLPEQLQVEVVFFESPARALAAAAAGDYAHLALLNTFASFPSDLVLAGLRAPHAVVYGVHPLPGPVDWARVERLAKDPRAAESLGSAGLKYNLVPAEPRGGGFWSFRESPESARPRVLIAKREAFAELSRHLDGGPVPADSVVQLDMPCGVLGQMAFEGCVGRRAVVR
jgi:hypothetical protein